MVEKGERQRKHPSKKDVVLAAGGFVALFVGVAAGKGYLGRKAPELEQEIDERFTEYRDKAAVLIDKSRGKTLRGINRMAALVAVLKSETPRNINALFGKQGITPSRAMVPLIREGIVRAETPEGSGGPLVYTFNPELLVFLTGDPETYKDFHVAYDEWQERLGSSASDNS